MDETNNILGFDFTHLRNGHNCEDEKQSVDDIGPLRELERNLEIKGHKYAENDTTIDRSLMLQSAIIKGDINQLKILNKLKMNFNQCINGKPAFLLAIQYHQFPALSYLLKNGMNLNLPMTPVNGNIIHYCIERKLFIELNQLIKHISPDEIRMLINKPDNNKDTPLLMAIKTDAIPPTTLQLLLDAGADICHKDVKGNNSLHATILKRNLQVLKLILKQSKVICVKDVFEHKGCTRGYDSLNNDNRFTVDKNVLNSHGVNNFQYGLLGPGCANTCDLQKNLFTGCTESEIVMESDSEITEKKKREPSYITVKGRVIERFPKEVIKDIDMYEESDIQMASIALNELNQHGYAPLHLAALSGNCIIAETLIQYGAQKNRKSIECYTPLHYAVSERDLAMVILFIKHYSDLNACIDVNKVTPLMLAVRKDGTVKLTKELIKGGALLNLQDNNGETALATGVYFGAERRSSLLIREGADPNIADFRQHTTPLYWAIFNNRKNLVKLLMHAGATLTHKQFRKFPRNLKIMRDTEMNSFLQHEVKNPKPLERLCSLAVRRHISSMRGGKGVVDTIEQLELPKRLEDSLLLNNIA
ncbi:unnamed protein product [Owenia fusiformis]|uniref:Uncharacterized protein n=1 Tax=Owenia fusiformis TaxID=6347 RepID=A0A8J1XRM7_OWEFU|nr:unnamed protein product [Owenia fusiformis]